MKLGRTRLSREQIRDILDKNIMEGEIETGRRYWLASFIFLPYGHPLCNTNASKLLREIMETTEGCYHPMEDTWDKLTQKIDILSGYMFYSRLNQIQTL